LGYETARVRKLLDRYVAGMRGGPLTRAHIEARAAR